jgi:hypothetical protein
MIVSSLENKTPSFNGVTHQYSIKFYFLSTFNVFSLLCYNSIMANYRGTGQSIYDIGDAPPLVKWTIVKGDTVAFRVYVTDDAKNPLVIADWDISAEFRRPDTANNFDQDTAGTVFILTPAPDGSDGDGEFTVKLTSTQSNQLRTGDVFDIELSDATRVWTVARGQMVVLEDVTD